MKRKRIKVSFADKIVDDAKKRGRTLEEQLEIVRWWRDVNARGNFRAQVACATAIDKLKGYYK